MAKVASCIQTAYFPDEHTGEYIATGKRDEKE